MFTYIDANTNVQATVNANTTLYLIRTPHDRYRLRGTTIEITPPRHDNLSYDGNFWPISAPMLLERMLSDSMLQQQLFPENSLTTAPLSLPEVILCLNINPTEIHPNRFAPRIISDFFMTSTPAPESALRPLREALLRLQATTDAEADSDTESADYPVYQG